MKLPEFQIEQAAPEPDGMLWRERFSHPQLDVENERLIATDGHILLRSAVRVSENDVSGPVTVSAMETARRCLSNSDTELIATADELVVQDEDGDVAKKSERPKAETRFPDAEQFFEGWSGRPDVILGAKVLRKMLSALSDHDHEFTPIAIWVKKDGTEPSRNAVLIAPCYGDVVGVIMPIEPRAYPIIAEEAVKRGAKK